MNKLILLHGVGLDRQIWHPLQAALPDIATHAPDLRGHGAGPNWDGPASLDGFVADLWNYADDEGLDRFALCGFSLGAMIAQWAALSKPNRISHLIVLNGTYNRTDVQLSAVQARYNEAKEHGPKAMINAALERWFPSAFAEKNPEYLAQIRLRLTANDTDQFLHSYKLFAYQGAQIVGRLVEITQPALVATGALDTGSTPEMTQQMASEMQNADAIIFNDAAHMLPMQKPKELAKLILGVLQKETT